MRVFILGNAGKPGVVAAAEELRRLLDRTCEVVEFDLGQSKDLGGKSADVAFVIGGDGAILRAARQMGYQQTPVLGVNLGKLGFLADLSTGEVAGALPDLAAGRCHITEHLMFECVIAPDGGPARPYLGLNDVVVQSGPPFHMIDLDLAVGDETVARYSGDGLIVSTPVGSTAHSLAAGGPILGQELDAFVITPLGPHTLTSRPVVDAAAKTYTITVRRSDAAYVIVDGQEIVPVVAGQTVTVRRAPVRFRLVKVPGKSNYRTLREKLRWGTGPNYRGEPDAG
jgi:NAD+ kinase